jgi:FKBP-type peptidyl-prolyl cis-trans isomerase FkpA
MTESAMESKLSIEEIREGSGDAAASGQCGQCLGAHGAGWFSDGVKLDSGRDRHEFSGFPSGRRDLIAAWDEGAQSPRAGSLRKPTIPPRPGCGAGTIVPPDATRVFAVERPGIR